MPWVRIDEEFPRHPKVVKAGPLGMAMHVAALCYCNQYLTDGFVPKGVAAGLLDLSGIGMRQWMGEVTGGGVDATWELVVEDLEAAGLWERVSGGWQIHDYHDYQPSREHVLKVRETRREVGRKGGQAKAKQVPKQVAKQPAEQTPSNSPAKAEAKTEAKAKLRGPGTGSRVSSPSGIPQASPTGRAATAATVTPIPTAQTFVAAYVDAYRGRAGHDPPSRVKGHLAKELGRLIADGIPADRIKAGFIEWFDRDQHPSTLASFVETNGRGGQPRSRASPITRVIEEDRKLARWAEQMEGGEPDAAERVAPDRGQARGQLPRPGPPG